MIEFQRLVENGYRRFKSDLGLSPPSFQADDQITRGTLEGAGGSVLLRYGPPEYHAELFVLTSMDRRRWGLADLLSLQGVRDWVRRNPPDTSYESRLEAEVEYAFRLLAQGLVSDARFDWLRGR